MADDDERGSDGSLVRQNWVLLEDARAQKVADRDTLADAARLLLGLASLAVQGARAVLDISTRQNGALVANERAAVLPRSGDAIWRAGHAAVGLGIETQRRCLAAVEVVAAPIATVASAVLSSVTARGPLAAGARALGRLSEQGLAEQRRSKEVALASGQEVIRAVIPAVIAELDIDSIVAQLDIDSIVAQLDIDSIVSRVDIDSIVSRVDINSIVSRLDIDSIVSRVDIDSIVGGVDLDSIVGRVDIDSIVSRIDLNAIAAKLDINAVVERVDLARVTEQVLDEVDVAHIVRESSGAIAAETVDAVRINGMLLDSFLSRVADRVLLRRAGRDTNAVTVSSTRPDDQP